MSNADAPKEPAQSVSGLLQPHPLTSAMQMAITFSALCIAAAAIIFAVRSMAEERNARLVEIGVGVLRADPTKEGHLLVAREWAMDLIDQNAGGLKFSQQARSALLSGKLDFEPYGSSFSSTYTPGYDSTYTPGYDSTFKPSSPARKN
jgi:hypothetical protein